MVTINGNLTVTGLASLNQLETFSASVSGTLFAADIVSPTLASLSAQTNYLTTQFTDYLATSLPGYQANIASLSAKLADLEQKLASLSATPSATSSPILEMSTASARITKLRR